MFQATHKKSYDSNVEESFRMKIFMENWHKIAIHNRQYELKQVPYKLGMNKYGDMVSSEKRFIN